MIKSKKAKARHYCLHYHNHRRYNDGKKGEPTIEILTGKIRKRLDCTLFDLVKEKDTSFFACSQEA